MTESPFQRAASWYRSGNQPLTLVGEHASGQILWVLIGIPVRRQGGPLTLRKNIAYVFGCGGIQAEQYHQCKFVRSHFPSLPRADPCSTPARAMLVEKEACTPPCLVELYPLVIPTWYLNRWCAPFFFGPQIVVFRLVSFLTPQKWWFEKRQPQMDPNPQIPAPSLAPTLHHFDSVLRLSP